MRADTNLDSVSSTLRPHNSINTSLTGLSDTPIESWDVRLSLGVAGNQF